MIIIHANLQVQPAQEQAFLEAAKTVIEGSRQEAGNISYDLKKSTDQEQHYTMVEVWKDAEAIQAHNTSEHFQAFVQKAPTFMAAPMDLNAYSAETVKI
ncbi:antibiotic biosynthesis monooxygenase [Planococcus halocryophilus Or1]|uniref:Antibiotic biosynthesis monooxygenase n=1 Tax=Planococcus halocryophilus TaxID=1215089 RepID=A0A1C7DQN4_9BACL|nr:putative quinol monooxygenase [Planococcus halocryophilus]ANU13930.1 antibiotic biosynthesis monooxygenase [Planococcus halocryophilus]EMF47476.1 antibiotic biosynthesis monooxygenase [Planococcus halocryophilus Or1]